MKQEEKPGIFSYIAVVFFILLFIYGAALFIL